MGLILIVMIGYFVFKYFEDNTGKLKMSGKNNAALDILSERYAKGEIDIEEYRYKKELLNQ
ncbi:putative membrane protein [Alkalibacterium subtropicum]|uniref:Putative membrane protein n=1 Tax=Alkalibacterium subtropicum TaxID=753702 RepID=A0A1I1FRM9_9LACT|nr:hypothetical protein [Alkalibacterium subtropicum]SFC01931.1 putative membrane protein [Alkalibacterium subtropicum]